MNRKEFNETAYNLRYDDLKADLATKIRIKNVLELVGRNKKILDLGCGDGFISEKIKNLGNEVIGLEISKKAANLCNKRGIKCIEHDLEKKLPFQNNKFDLVFGGEIIEHIFDTDSFLKEIKRVLKRKGFLILTTPNIASLNRRIRLLFGLNPLIETGLGKGNAGHVRYFTKNSLEELLNRNGFSIEEWKSDFVLLKSFRSTALAKLFPSLGWGLIVKARLK